jgi:hypothetical protein
LAAAAFYPKMNRATVILPEQSQLELGCVSAVDANGRTNWIVDAHRGDGKRFVVHADEQLSAFVELELAIHARGE